MKNGPFKLYLLRRSRFRLVELDKCFVVLDLTRESFGSLSIVKQVLRGKFGTLIIDFRSVPLDKFMTRFLIDFQGVWIALFIIPHYTLLLSLRTNENI